MYDRSTTGAEGIIILGLLVCYGLFLTVAYLRRTRPEFSIWKPLAVAIAIRYIAIAAVDATGLAPTLRGGDETTFLSEASVLAHTPWGTGFLPHTPYQLHTVLFAAEMKALNLSQPAMRLTQVGLALLGVVLIVAAVYDLGGPRPAKLTAWILALEPASIFFDSALHKEPLMMLASGLVVFGGTKLWLRLDIRGILICALGGLIAVETRSYAGWFLVSASVLVLLHAAVRSMDRPMRALPLVYAVIAIAFIATPVLLQASSKKNLAVLQQSQTANATGAGQGGTGGANGSNLALEQVNFSTRGAILANLPKRVRDLVLKPYPWQLGNPSQRLGAFATLLAYAVLALLLWSAWQCRGRVFGYAGPILYPMFFLLVAYSLSVGNAGTGFRYRTHIVTLGIAAAALLGVKARELRAERQAKAIEDEVRRATTRRGARPILTN